MEKYDVKFQFISGSEKEKNIIFLQKESLEL